ncbi:TPA: LegC family aminotransferase [Vibrio vulnificus]|uniref:Aminotransferase, DegT family n=1 Tax=Vibrio vulnificus (strain CMCP6) TaxID=216895 RepID=A0A3Q0L2P4_VIBVU|nr:LegC family aminotransferase [Vibrio vulnificus]AAO09314.1 Putative aminotransferase, DegT family [Vibrio vulnificus CMCP6]ADV87828.1 bacillosamine/legionaminic acid biosynthesis aminotransferase PglE / 4-keto-6-deoxy-N-Acetyl-D-hexosaminyl-(Lipid carrier) aminotransferase [Vibrio vulnificus MO6-24/O]EGR0057822.1 LegC family aminotransferase [Vibrio vulnificus]EGR0790142.1 LegC family aminotransferase [Vibrio vulnificus]EGR0796139.1 LegC family aminotransferase [Vibrio vulnificus]
MNAQLLVEFVRDQYQTQDFIPLHAPTFAGNEKAYVMETIDSTFVSSVGKFVDEFERKMEAFTGTPKAVATVNGTAALHAALYMAGVERGDLVITQALTFVATCNALYHMGAEPIFVDVSPVSLGLCPKAMSAFLEDNAQVTEAGCIHKQTGRRIKAVVPMHTFGHPVELDELVAVCLKWNISLVEDAAESLGSFYKGKHTGTIGDFGAVSFNGNKIITTGGGGMVLCGSEEAGRRTKHVTTTAKVPHPYEFFHDEPGFNYRMPNLNAALGCAQMEVLEHYLAQKRQLAHQYQAFFASSDVTFVVEPEYAQSNYWLNAIICADAQQRNELLEQTNAAGVMTRPIWQLMHRLPMFEQALRGDLTHSEFIEAHLINLPSTPVA